MKMMAAGWENGFHRSDSWLLRRNETICRHRKQALPEFDGAKFDGARLSQPQRVVNQIYFEDIDAPWLFFMLRLGQPRSVH